MRLPLLLLLSHAVLSVQTRAGDWPAFLGPKGDATSPESGLIDRLPPHGPPAVWSRPVGTGYSAPSLLSGQLVLHHRVGDEERVEAFEARTGRPLWHHASPTSFQDPFGYNNGPRASPLLTSNRVFTFGAEGRLLALDRTSGRLLWERDTAVDFTVPEAFFGVGSSPVLDAGHLVVMVGGQPNSGVVAFDPETGATRWESVGEANWSGLPMIGWPGTPDIVWRHWDKQASYASPVPATFHGQRHTLCLTRQGLVSLNPTNGAVRFSFWFRARVNESVNAANPVVRDDLILISAAYYRVGSVLLRVRPDGQAVDEVWRGTALEMHWATPLLVGDHLYGFSGRNEPDAAFRCVEFLSGRIAWQRDDRWSPRSSRQPPVFGRGSLIHADGKLIALGEGGLLGLFRPAPDGCHELGRWQVPDLSYPCWAGPVLADGLLYLRGEDRLVCLDLRAGTAPRPPDPIPTR